MVPGDEGERYRGEVDEGEDEVAQLEAGERVTLDGLGTAAGEVGAHFRHIRGPRNVVFFRAGHEIQDVEEVREDEDEDGGGEPEAVAPRGVLDGVAVHGDGVLAFGKRKLL